MERALRIDSLAPALMPTLPSNPSATPGGTLEGPLVLVVEDDEDTRFLHAESLGHLGYRAAGHVPVMLFSALAASERTLQAGADAFLGKPLEKESFLASMLVLTDPGNRRGALPRRRRVVL